MQTNEPNINHIVQHIFNDAVVPKVINSGRLRRFGISRTNTDIKEIEAAVMLRLLAQPEKTIAAYKNGTIVKHVSLCIADACNVEKRHKKRYIPTSNTHILEYYADKQLSNYK